MQCNLSCYSRPRRAAKIAYINKHQGLDSLQQTLFANDDGGAPVWGQEREATKLFPAFSPSQNASVSTSPEDDAFND